MEGHLPCIKFLVSEGPSPTHILGARNDNGETPKMLSQQFYKQHVADYISNVEWERDHPEESESEYGFLVQNAVSLWIVELCDSRSVSTELPFETISRGKSLSAQMNTNCS